MTKKLYIIDDDADFLSIVSHILRGKYLILTSSSLDTAHVADFQPDLILMDNSVGADHAEFMIGKLHEAFPRFTIPVILVSAHHDIGKLAARKGVNGFIRKPSSIAYIRSYVDNFFANRESQIA